MKKESLEGDDLLLEYLDGTLPPEKLQRVKKALASSDVMRRRLEELKALVDVLQQLSPEEPSKKFTAQVIQNLGRYSTTATMPLRNGILLLSGVLVAIIMGAFLLSSGIFDAPGSIDLNEFVTSQQFMQKSLPSISLNGRWIVNIIILINLALAFLILDRAILRPWMERRTEMHL
jgi:hypothetical protein